MKKYIVVEDLRKEKEDWQRVVAFLADSKEECKVLLKNLKSCSFFVIKKFYSNIESVKHLMIYKKLYASNLYSTRFPFFDDMIPSYLAKCALVSSEEF